MLKRNKTEKMKKVNDEACAATVIDLDPNIILLEVIDGLVIRVASKQIRNRKVHLHVVVKDMYVTMLVSSHYGALIVNVERNTLWKIPEALRLLCQRQEK